MVEVLFIKWEAAQDRSVWLEPHKCCGGTVWFEFFFFFFYASMLVMQGQHRVSMK